MSSVWNRVLFETCTRFLIRYLILSCLAILVGAAVGGLVGYISCSMIGEEPRDGLNLGAHAGAIIGLVFYSVTHWLVFRKPLWATALFLIGGTLVGSVPVSFIPVFGIPFMFFGGILGYWLGVVALLVTTWGYPGGNGDAGPVE